MYQTLIFLLLLPLSFAWAQEDILMSDFRSGLAKFKIGALAEQSYCYDQGQGPKGYQITKLKRIASLTKVMTTLFASETVDLHKRYELKVHVSNDSLHIEGSKDPYFEEDKMFLLFKALNDLGYRSFKTVTMDDNFIFSDEALSEHREITPAYSRSRLSFFTNKANRRALLEKWKSVQKFASEEGIDLSQTPMPELAATSVKISSLPLGLENKTIYVHRSLPLHRLLKTMNVQSKNIVAHNIYLSSNKFQPFNDFMTKNGFKSSEYAIYNGSGLPVINGSRRLDNLGTCALILKLFPMLEKSLKKHKLVLSDVLAVNGGKDLGSFRDRFKPYPETWFAVLSKTGTLVQTSTLAGIAMMDGATPFAILNHTTNTSAARSFQDFFVSRLFQDLGTPTPIPYIKIPIFPWTEADFFEVL